MEPERVHGLSVNVMMKIESLGTYAARQMILQISYHKHGERPSRELDYTGCGNHEGIPFME